MEKEFPSSEEILSSTSALLTFFILLCGPKTCLLLKKLKPKFLLKDYVQNLFSLCAWLTQEIDRFSIWLLRFTALVLFFSLLSLYFSKWLWFGTLLFLLSLMFLPFGVGNLPSGLIWLLQSFLFFLSFYYLRNFPSLSFLSFVFYLLCFPPSEKSLSFWDLLGFYPWPIFLALLALGKGWPISIGLFSVFVLFCLIFLFWIYPFFLDAFWRSFLLSLALCPLFFNFLPKPYDMLAFSLSLLPFSLFFSFFLRINSLFLSFLSVIFLFLSVLFGAFLPITFVKEILYQAFFYQFSFLTLVFLGLSAFISSFLFSFLLKFWLSFLENIFLSRFFTSLILFPLFLLSLKTQLIEGFHLSKTMLFSFEIVIWSSLILLFAPKRWSSLMIVSSLVFSFWALFQVSIFDLSQLSSVFKQQFLERVYLLGPFLVLLWFGGKENQLATYFGWFLKGMGLGCWFLLLWPHRILFPELGLVLATPLVFIRRVKGFSNDWLEDASLIYGVLLASSLALVPPLMGAFSLYT